MWIKGRNNLNEFDYIGMTNFPEDHNFSEYSPGVYRIVEHVCYFFDGDLSEFMSTNWLV